MFGIKKKRRKKKKRPAKQEEKQAKRDKEGRFVKGFSGNPKGRDKKGYTLTDIFLAEMSKEELAQLIINKIRKSKDNALMRFVYNHIDGMPIQKVEHKGTVDVLTQVTEITEILKARHPEALEDITKSLRKKHESDND